MYIYIPKIIFAQLKLDIKLNLIIIKKSLIQCIDEKTKELSNAFGT